MNPMSAPSSPGDSVIADMLSRGPGRRLRSFGAEQRLRGVRSRADLRQQHRREAEPSLPLSAILLVGGQELRDPGLERGEVVGVGVERAAPEPQQGAQVLVLGCEQAVEILGQTAEEDEEGLPQLRGAHGAQALLVDVRHLLAERERALERTAHLALLDHGQQLGVEQGADVPVESGLGDVRQRLPQLRGGEAAPAQLLDDPQPHGMGDRLGERRRFGHRLFPHRYHPDNIRSARPFYEPEESAMTPDESTATGTPPLRVDGLTKSFGAVRAVEDVSFTVRPGRVTGFLGPNGAGKSTTLRMLLGLISPGRGSAQVLGRDYRTLPAPARAVGAVLDLAGAHPGMTARDHLRTCAALSALPAGRVEAVLEETGS